jgi:hypothetical protein
MILSILVGVFFFWSEPSPAVYNAAMVLRTFHLVNEA